LQASEVIRLRGCMCSKQYDKIVIAQLKEINSLIKEINNNMRGVNNV